MSTTSKRPAAIAAAAAIALGAVGGTAAVAAAAHGHKNHKQGQTGSSSTSPQGAPGRGDRHGPPVGDHRMGARGTVTAISESSITVKALDGTETTYAIDGSATFAKERSSATAADVTVGSTVMVIASSSSATTAATIVIDLPHLAGTVTAVDGSTITVADQEGFWRTISTSGSTTYTTNGSAGSSADVVVGKVIMAEGAVASDHTTLNASSITVGLPAQGQAGGRGDHGPMGGGWR